MNTVDWSEFNNVVSLAEKPNHRIGWNGIKAPSTHVFNPNEEAWYQEGYHESEVTYGQMRVHVMRGYRGRCVSYDAATGHFRYLIFVPKVDNNPNLAS